MKNRIVKVICLAAILLGTSSMAQAQFRQSIFLNGVLPTGSFTDKISGNTPVPLGTVNIAKHATAGFGLGYRISYRFDVGMGEVAPFANADFFWNFMGGDMDGKYTQAKANTPNYFNVPVMLGVSYLYDELWNDITLYGEFCIGTDFMFIGREKSDNFLHTYAYKPSLTRGLAWMVGFGAYFGRHVSAGLYYYNLGKHTIEYTNRTYNSFSAPERVWYDAQPVETRYVGELALRIGFHF